MASGSGAPATPPATPVASQMLNMAKSFQVLPIISRPGAKSERKVDSSRDGGSGSGGAGAHVAAVEAGGGAEYALTQEEERLVQACQSSLNSAGGAAACLSPSVARDWRGHALTTHTPSPPPSPPALALVLQSFATGLLVTASLATDHVGEAITDGIQVVNKAIAAELIFVATSNIDNALYSEGWWVAVGGCFPF